MTRLAVPEEVEAYVFKYRDALFRNSVDLTALRKELADARKALLMADLLLGELPVATSKMQSQVYWRSVNSFRERFATELKAAKESLT
jgi:hypothetical protein